MTAKIYSLQAYRVALDDGLEKTASAVASRHAAIEMAALGVLPLGESSGPFLTVPVAVPAQPSASARLSPGDDHFFGAKYDIGNPLDIADIAKLVRADLKAQVKAKHIPTAKYSVSISRYSGGRSMTIRVAGLPDTFPLLNPKRVHSDAESASSEGEGRYSVEGQEFLDKITGIGNAYRYDRSDLQSDYFNTNYYLHVSLDADMTMAMRAAILADASSAHR